MIPAVLPPPARDAAPRHAAADARSGGSTFEDLLAGTQAHGRKAGQTDADADHVGTPEPPADGQESDPTNDGGSPPPTPTADRDGAVEARPAATPTPTPTLSEETAGAVAGTPGTGGVRSTTEGAPADGDAPTPPAGTSRPLPDQPSPEPGAEPAVTGDTAAGADTEVQGSAEIDTESATEPDVEPSVETAGTRADTESDHELRTDDARIEGTRPEIETDEEAGADEEVGADVEAHTEIDGETESDTATGLDRAQRRVDARGATRAGRAIAEARSPLDVGTSTPSDPAADTAAPAAPTGAGRVGAAAPASASTTPPNAPAAPPVADQLVHRVTPLLDGRDGTQELTLELRPAELGRVVLEVTVEDGTVSIRVRADEAISRQLLDDALPELRASLQRAGVRTGDLDVGGRAPDGTADGDQPGRRDRSGDRANGRGETDPGSRATRPRPVGASHTALDVLL